MGYMHVGAAKITISQSLVSHQFIIAVIESSKPNCLTLGAQKLTFRSMSKLREATGESGATHTHERDPVSINRILLLKGLWCCGKLLGQSNYGSSIEWLVGIGSFVNTIGHWASIKAMGYMVKKWHVWVQVWLYCALNNLERVKPWIFCDISEEPTNLSERVTLNARDSSSTASGKFRFSQRIASTRSRAQVPTWALRCDGHSHSIIEPRSPTGISLR